MSFIAFGIGTGLSVIGAGVQVAMSMKGRSERRQTAIDARKKMLALEEEYKDLDTTNLASTIKNRFEGMENTFEDMTVNQQQARFQAQQFQQTQTNIMQNLQGAAGGSGIAALAQAMAGQQSQNAQQAASSIGAQEQQLQQAERGEASRLQGKNIEGNIMQREAEFSKLQSNMQMAQDRLGAAKQARRDATSSMMSGISGTVSGAGQAGLLKGIGI